MKHLFVPYTLVLLAKEKGFDEPCLTKWMPTLFTQENQWAICSLNSINLYAKEEQTDCHVIGFTGYKNSVPAHYGLKSVAAPLYQQAIDWLEDNHEISPLVEYYINHNGGFSWRGGYKRMKGLRIVFTNTQQLGQTKQMAWNIAITEALKLI